MRPLFVCLLCFCGALSATPIVEKHMSPPSVQSLPAPNTFRAVSEFPVSVPSPSISDPLDIVPLTDDNLLIIAFLANFPGDVTLAQFRGAAVRSGKVQIGGALESLPLDSAGNLLTAGGGIFLLLVLAMGLVEHLRFALEIPD